RLVSATGTEPVERAGAAGYDSTTIRRLVEDSTEAGVLDEASGAQISRIIGLENLTVDDIIATHAAAPTSVARIATVADVQAAAQSSGHLRILIDPSTAEQPMVVHVRDTLDVEAEHPARRLARPALEVAAGTSVYSAFQQMRLSGEQLAVVRRGTAFLGVITWADVLKQIWPIVEDQLTDTSRFR